MKCTALLASALLLYICVAAQTDVKKLSNLYYAKQYNEAIAAGKENIIKGYDLPSSNLLVGRCYVDILKDEAGIPHLHKALSLDADETWISGWAHAYLGLALIRTGDKDSGLIELKKCLALKKTENSVDFAKHVLSSVTSPEDVAAKMDMLKIESDSINYYFQDTDGLLQPVWRYTQRHDSAYRELCKIFHPRPPQKLRFFVFTQKEKAEKTLGRRLGFTDAREGVCYSMADQTLAHEMCHFISFWAGGTPTVNVSKFINEGIAVCFDMRREDVFERARVALQQQNFKGSVLEIWSREHDFSSELIYPVGGAFLWHLYTRMKTEDFLAFAKDQSFTHLRSLLGADFDGVIKEFDVRVYLAK